MVNNVKIGIIGSGGIAKGHARAYMNMNHVEIVGVADVVPGKAKAFIEELNISGAKAFENHQDLLKEELDGVSVCTPNFAHYDTTIDALNAAKHVLVEKPLSVTLEQGIDMVQTAEARDKMLSVGYQPRYDPNMRKIVDIVRGGELGEVYYVEVGGGRRRGMPGGTFINKDLAGFGAIGDIGTYSLDLALNALNHPKPLTVSAYTSNHFGTNPLYHPEAENFEVEDFGVAMVRFENDLVLNFKISWAMHMDSLGPTMFLGKDAGLKIKPSGTGPWSGVWDGGVGEIVKYYDQDGEHVKENIEVQEHNMNIFAAKIEDFVDAIKNNRKAPIPAKEIIINQAIIDGIIRSSKVNQEVQIDLPDF